MKTIKTPLTFKNGRVETVTKAEEIARQKITDVVATSPGERVMRPTYGAGAYSLLYEPIDPLVLADFRAEAIMDIQDNVSDASIIDLTFTTPSSAYGDPTTLEMMVTYATTLGGVTTSSITLSENEEV